MLLKCFSQGFYFYVWNFIFNYLNILSGMSDSCICIDIFHSILCSVIKSNFSDY